MRPTQMLQAGGGDAPARYLGGWGNFGGSKQRGIITYGLSANRQNPLAGAAHAAIFNSWRRFRGQVLYVAPYDLLLLRHGLGHREHGRHELGDAE
ncbi:cytochrome b-c1 complex subunit 8 [Apiospora aurea]|uniref:Cytochrome b-c1 complex subunit 8 n=1 Tax=Apiospora aurea TaxID=335848 RepID=A0ABR1QDK4_9PEZI